MARQEGKDGLVGVQRNEEIRNFDFWEQVRRGVAKRLSDPTLDEEVRIDLLYVEQIRLGLSVALLWERAIDVCVFIERMRRAHPNPGRQDISIVFLTIETSPSEQEQGLLREFREAAAAHLKEDSTTVPLS